MQNRAASQRCGVERIMKIRVGTALQALALSATFAAPAMALENPVTVDLRASDKGSGTASATLFERGSIVLVNVSTEGGMPKDGAITLNGGTCANPGGVQFALAPLANAQSMTELKHSLAEVAGRAKSMIVHKTSSETSPGFACGNLKG